MYTRWASLVAQVVKYLPAMQETCAPSWVRKSLGRREWHPLPCSCLDNPIDKGAQQTTVHGIAKSQTQLRD